MTTNEQTIAEFGFCSNDQLDRRLIELSADGRAWYGHVIPFSDGVHFYHAASPSKFSDMLFARGNCIGWKGAVVPFSKAAHIREQNRGVSCE